MLSGNKWFLRWWQVVISHVHISADNRKPLTSHAAALFMLMAVLEILQELYSKNLVIYLYSRPKVVLLLGPMKTTLSID